MSNCKHLFHTFCPKYDANEHDKCKQTLKNIINKCLNELKNLGFKSIAFPAIGTGALKYPTDFAANTMIETFLQEPSNSQFEIQIVVYEKDDAVYEVSSDLKNKKILFEIFIYKTFRANYIKKQNELNQQREVQINNESFFVTRTSILVIKLSRCKCKTFYILISEVNFTIIYETEFISQTIAVEIKRLITNYIIDSTMSQDIVKALKDDKV